MSGFFMLSGFSLYYTYKDKDLTKNATISKFYLKRLIRIIPSYWFVMCIYIFILGEESFIQNLILFPAELIGIQSVFGSLFAISHNSGTWFISCSLLCYFIFPFVSECFKQLGIKMKVCVIIISSMILLYGPFVVYVFNLNSIYSNPFFRILEFIIGVSIASFLGDIRQSSFIKKVLGTKLAILIEFMVLIIAITIAVKLNFSVGNYMLYSWIALPLFVLMFIGLPCIDFSAWNKKIIIYLSQISYAFFLAQFFTWPIVKSIIQSLGHNSNGFRIIFSLIICTLLAIAMHEGIEKPCAKSLNKRLNKQ